MNKKARSIMQEKGHKKNTEQAELELGEAAPNVTIQDNILREAERLIFGARNKTYRHATENFNNIANLWNAYFEAIKVRPMVVTAAVRYPNMEHEEISFKINNIDVAYLNILQKVARGATNQEHLDTIVDIAGYAGCIERILKNK